MPRTTRIRASAVVPISTPRFVGPRGVRATLVGCYQSRSLRVPRDGTRAIGYMLRSLTFGCRRTMRGLGRYLPSPVHRLGVVKKNSRGGLLGRLATSTLGVPICTNPIRTATVNGVLARTVTGKRVSSLQRLERVMDQDIAPRMCCPGGWGMCKGAWGQLSNPVLRHPDRGVLSSS